MTEPHVHGPDCNHDHDHDHKHDHGPALEVDSNLEMSSPVQAELSVSVPWTRVKKELQDGYREVAKHAKVRGFRPGKAPMNVVKQMYGKRVREDVTSHLVEMGLLMALQKHELDIVAQPQVIPEPLADDQPLSFKASLEVRPKIEKVETADFSIEKEVYEVEDKDVDREIEGLRMQNAETRTPEPTRGAQANDILKIDYKVFAEDGELESLGAEGREVSLGTNELAEAFEEGLLGVQPGETRTVSMTCEDDHPNEELRGKDARFEVTVQELRERLLPDLDDDFAKDVGDYETLLELRLKTRERLEKLAAEQSEAGLKRAIIDKLIDLNPIEVPPTLVAREQQQSLYQMASYAYMTQQPFNAEEAQGPALESGQRRVKAALLLGALARQEEISFEPADIDVKLQEIAERTGKHIAKVKAEYAEQRDALENEVLEEKLIGHLRTIAKITDRRINDAEAGS